MKDSKNPKNSKIKIYDGLLKKNMILSGGTLLAVCVVFCTHFSNALFLSVAFLFTGAVSITLTAIFFPPKKYILGTAACAIFAALAYIPFYMIAESVVPELCEEAGIYLPLVTICDIWLFRMQKRTFDNFGFGKGLLRTIFSLLGAVIAFIIIGSVREILAYGSFAGVKLFKNPPLDSAAQVWFGLIMIGLIAGIVRKAYSIADKKEGENI